MLSKSNKIKKLFLIFIIFSLILSFLNVFIDKLLYGNSLEKLALNNAVNKSSEREEAIRNFLKKSDIAITSIRQDPLFKEYLYDNTNFYEVQNMFFTFTKSQANFMQFRFIDKTGMEQIRIERTEEGAEPYIVPFSKLQNKEDRYYFNSSKSRTLEKTWFSSLDLNEENGKVTVPYKPTIRAVLPLKKDGEFNGIIIINYFLDDFLSHLLNTPFYDLILFNNAGNTLIHYDSNKNWGAYKASKINVYDEYPELRDNYKSLIKKEDYIYRKLDLPIFGGLNFIFKLKQTYIQKEIGQSNVQHTLVTFATFLASLILTLLIIKFYAKDLLNAEEIKKLNTDLENASKVAKIGFWEYDKQNLEWSDGVYDIFELDKGFNSITYDEYISFVPLPDKNKINQLYEESISKKEDYYAQYKIVTERGNTKYIEERATHYFDKNGKFEKSVGSIFDITQTFLSNYELEVQKKEFETIFNYSKDGIVILDKQSNFIKFNTAFLKMTRYKDAQLENMFCLELISNEDRDKFSEAIKKVYDNEFVESFELSINSASNNRIYMNISLSLLPNKKDILMVAKDISTLRIIQEQTRLASLGEMIGNIAHQWRQPLSAITTISSGINLKLEYNEKIADEELKQYATKIFEQSKYLSKTIDNFRNFINSDKSYKQINVKESVRSALTLVEASFKSNYINLIVNIEDDIVIVGNKNELTEGLINIFNNSKDILKEIENEDDRILLITTKRVDEYRLELKILDSGGGIDKDVITKVFEPYFTTKHQSQGTGLGLAMADKIIRERHKAEINVYNEEFTYKDKIYIGACFSIIFTQNMEA